MVQPATSPTKPDRNGTPVTDAVTDLAQPEDLNQQTYQQLKLALSLNLRRQIFVAVCDDLILRDRLAGRLQAELAQATSRSYPESFITATGQLYPRLVTLNLSLRDPNPLAQISHWLNQFPPPKNGERQAPIPAFQVLGIEHLTRQPASSQRLFLTYLQGIERSLAGLETSLLFWMPQPWFRAIPQSAPEFWRCRTGVFEFVGEPRPLPTVVQQVVQQVVQHPTQRQQNPQSTPTHQVSPTQPPANPPSSSAPLPDQPTDSPQALASDLASDLDVPSADLWSMLSYDLANFELSEDLDDDLDAALVGLPEFAHSRPDLSPLLLAPVQVVPITQTESARHNGHHALKASSPASDQAQSSQAALPASTASTTNTSTNTSANTAANASNAVTNTSANTNANAVTNTNAVTHTSANTNANTNTNTERTASPWQTPNPVAVAEAIASLKAATAGEAESLALVEQIEQLQQQNDLEGVAHAYRHLGNLYRDRIEQGQVSIAYLRISIQAYEQTLNWLPDLEPIRADILNDVGNLYWMIARRLPDATHALEQLQRSVSAYQQALTQVDPPTQSQTYSMLQSNLGTAYGDLARYHDPVENLQQSVQAYHRALEYRQAKTDPARYASTQNNLGTTYWNLAQHQQPKDNLKQAIASYSDALRYYDPHQEPLSYAMIQNNLGTAYWNLSQHERSEDWLMLALTSYRTALKYRTREASPTAFAATQNNLGTAYWHLANQTQSHPDVCADYLKQAIAAYEAALEAAEAQKQTGEILNFDLLATRNNLGLAHYQIATDPHLVLEANARANHLDAALQSHLQAFHGWQTNAELRQTALTCVLQTIRAIYTHCGLPGQNRALSQIPGQLLPEILPQL